MIKLWLNLLLVVAYSAKILERNSLNILKKYVMKNKMITYDF